MREMTREERLETLGLDRHKQVCLAVYMGVPEIGQISRIPKGKQRAKARKRLRRWKRLRYDALKRSRGVCELCGAGPANGSRLNVDHILPISKFPKRGKGARDTTDWRRVEA